MVVVTHEMASHAKLGDALVFDGGVIVELGSAKC